MKTAIIIDNTGLGKTYTSSFSHEDTQWLAVETEGMIGEDIPDLVIFMQLPKAIPDHWKMPVFLNDTTGLFRLSKEDVRPIARFCGWPTMIERTVWEIAAYNNASTDWTEAAAKLLNRKLSMVPDRPGFIAPRVIASIINEACYGLADGICTADDMDVAMRLGTNYPKGPIAWMQEIGKENIASLLTVLAMKDTKYTPHPLLNLE